MRQVRWNLEKAEALKKDKDRNSVGFEECVIALEDDKVLDDLPHPTRENQRILVLEINGYAHAVPYVEEKDGTLFLKTVFPSRKYHAQYLRTPRQ